MSNKTILTAGELLELRQRLDEIDTGISGEVAMKMVNMMLKMSENHQVITISHLPQIAAKGHQHYFVYKDNSAEKSVSKIKLLSNDERSFEIAKPLADALDIILIRSAEITRSMPPGHINALFIKNANLLEREDGLDAIREAREQGAFLLWNHPGWKAQQPDTTIWWEEHTQLLKNDLLHGIEVFNEKEFYPEALTWAKQKKLAVLCNSDVHGPTNMSYDLEQANRPLTLVFSENRSVGSIKDALFKRRTAAFFDNTLAGPSSLLEPLFFSSLKMKKQALGLEDQKSVTVDIINNSDLDYELELVQPTVGFEAPETLTLKAQHATTMELTGNSPDVGGLSELEIYYSVKNMLVGEDKNLVVTFSFQNK